MLTRYASVSRLYFFFRSSSFLYRIRYLGDSDDRGKGFSLALKMMDFRTQRDICVESEKIALSVALEAESFYYW